MSETASIASSDGYFRPISWDSTRARSHSYAFLLGCLPISGVWVHATVYQHWRSPFWSAQELHNIWLTINIVDIWRFRLSSMNYGSNWSTFWLKIILLLSGDSLPGSLNGASASLNLISIILWIFIIALLYWSKAFLMNDCCSVLLEVRFRDPHCLKCGQWAQNGATNPS